MGISHGTIVSIFLELKARESVWNRKWRLLISFWILLFSLVYFKHIWIGYKLAISKLDFPSICQFLFDTDKRKTVIGAYYVDRIRSTCSFFSCGAVTFRIIQNKFVELFLNNFTNLKIINNLVWLKMRYHAFMWIATQFSCVSMDYM